MEKERGNDANLEAAAQRVENARKALLAQQEKIPGTDEKTKTLDFILSRIVEEARDLRAGNKKIRLGITAGRNALRNGYAHLGTEMIDEFDVAIDEFIGNK